MDLMCHSDSQQASSLLQEAQAVIQIQSTMSAIYRTEFSYLIQVLTAMFKTQKSLQNTTRANERINRTYPNEVDEGAAAAAAVSLWQILYNNEFPIPFFLCSRYESCA
jgi:galactokinase/mevalonate kinase-like predicted kinase